MEKVFRIVKQGEDDANLRYWARLSYAERLTNLETIRQEVITRFYGTRPQFQRVYRIIKRA
jgi:adenine-specific DNA glycosylase